MLCNQPKQVASGQARLLVPLPSWHAHCIKCMLLLLLLNCVAWAGCHGPAGTQQLLAAAAQTFKQESSRLQSKVHSTYQRSIASTLTRMRVMHVLEDNTTGAQHTQAGSGAEAGWLGVLHLL